MNICLVAKGYPPDTASGGIGTQTYHKARGLSALGHKVHVVSSSWSQEARTYHDEGAVIHRIPEPELKVPGYESSTRSLAYSTSVAQKLYTLSKDIDFDIIQFPEWEGEGFIYQTDTFRHRTACYVVQLHGPLAMLAEYTGSPDRNSTLHQIGCFMERTVLHHADRVLASSHNTAAFCAQRYDYPLPEIRVVYSGIDTAKFLPRTNPQDKRQPKILFVGTLSRIKGLNFLVRAVLELKARYPNICLRVIGREEGREGFLEPLKERIAAAGAETNFEFKGYIPYDELADHYAWCDFFAGPSLHEPGPGNVYLEAMACGKSVIACNTGGAPEVVRNQETGLLVPPGDTKSLEKAITTLTEDANLRGRLGKNGRMWVEENVSVEKYIAKVEHLYQELTAEKAISEQKSPMVSRSFQGSGSMNGVTKRRRARRLARRKVTRFRRKATRLRRKALRLSRKTTHRLIANIFYRS